MTTMKTPVYFLSHGGPNIMYDQGHPAHGELRGIGREITTRVQPKAVVIFSAHWQPAKDHVEVNQAEQTELIYDFYNFPAHYYQETFPNNGSPVVAQRILELLREAGIEARGVERGLDHGVWAASKVMFDPAENALNVPIVQVSLYDNESPEDHFQLGQAIAKLRSENILVIGSGMAVHNLSDRSSFRGPNKHSVPYTASFDAALREAVTGDPQQRHQNALELLQRPDARQAHPTFDHIMPLYVACGIAQEDTAESLFTYHEGSLSWAQYRFGGLPG